MTERVVTVVFYAINGWEVAKSFDSADEARAYSEHIRRVWGVTDCALETRVLKYSNFNQGDNNGER